MAGRKKVLKEEAEATEVDKEIETPVNEDSAAAETLKPGSKSVDDPKSRYEMLAAVIGSAATARDETLTKWYNEMISSTKGDVLSKEIPDGAASSNKASINTKGNSPQDLDKSGPPSTGQTSISEPSEETIEVVPVLKAAAKEDLAKILGEQEGLSEEFKEKTTVLFEAALEARLGVERVKIQEEEETKAQAEVESSLEQIEEQIQNYIDYVANEWMTENEVSIQSALRNEITEDFMAGLKDLFTQHYISIPEDQVDVVEQLSKTVDELETRLTESINEIADLKGKLDEASRKDITEEAAEGLTLVEAENLKKMASSIEADDAEEFKSKLNILKESTFVKQDKKSVLNEQLEEVDEANLPPEEKKYSDPQMKSYVSAISRTVKR
jgi:AcrR family transcriptional regulator